MISVYNKKISLEVGQRKIELFKKYEDIVQRGRADPVWFIENFLDVILTDYQKWIISSAWTKQTVCLVCSRNSGKSFIIALYAMARAILFPSSKIWIMSMTAAQAQDTFTKIEDLAKFNIQSVANENCIFWNETVKSQANSDGFVHDKSSYKTSLFNGSEITTLVGKAESIVGKRSNLNIFDEAALISRDFFARAEPFTTQSADFLTGGDIDLEIYPSNLPNQNIYLSSAGDTNGHLWEKYKDCAKRMAMGFDDCFVADISCEIPLNPTINGKKYPPLFDRAKVDAMMRTNPYRGLREYYNVFDQSGGTDMVIGRDILHQARKNYLPVFQNKNPESIYGLFYDSAFRQDNSVVLACEFFKDKDNGWMMKVLNLVNLIRTLPNGDKKPMRTSEQIDWLHELMISYSGPGQEYNNLHLGVDAGAGGGGPVIMDLLLSEWQDDVGLWHHGVIDMNDEFAKSEATKFPNAIPGVLDMVSAVKHKSEQYGAVTEMCTSGLVILPSELPTTGKVEIDGKIISLTAEEARAMLEIDLMVEEVLLMRKFVSDAGQVRYALQTELQRTAHDDRAYVFSMACHFLQKLRRQEIYAVEVQGPNMGALLKSCGARTSTSFQKKTSPFSNRLNPFRR